VSNTIVFGSTAAWFETRTRIARLCKAEPGSGNLVLQRQRHRTTAGRQPDMRLVHIVERERDPEERCEPLGLTGAGVKNVLGC
jgi:hypothetical protein